MLDYAKSCLTLWPHGLQHSRLPYPSLSLGVCSNSCPFSWGCHPTISSSVVPFSSCPPSSPASGSFPVSWLFTLGGQNIGTSASVFSINIQGWFPLGLTGLISSLSKKLKSFLQHHSLKASILQCSVFFIVTLISIHDYFKNIALTIRTFVGKAMPLLLILCLGLS